MTLAERAAAAIVNAAARALRAIARTINAHTARRRYHR